MSGDKISDESIRGYLQYFRKNIYFSNAGGCKIIPHYFKKNYSLKINHKKIYRLCREQNLLLPKRKKQNKKYRKISENRKITFPNQLWQFDIKCGYIHGENRHFYFLAFKDIFTKEIMGYHIGRSCKGIDLKITFERIIKSQKVELQNLVIRSDNGPQMTSHQFRDYVDSIVHHEFIPPACPNKNAYIESFFSIFETEFLVPNYFKNYYEVYQKIVDYIIFYNTERLHGSIKKLPPKEFKQRYLSGEFGILECSA